MRATVVVPASSITSEKFIEFSHTELYNILSLFISSITLDCSTYDSALALASSSVSWGRVLMRPDGSPIIAVKSPITSTAW